MRFEVRHELDAPIESVELGLASVDLAAAVAARLPKVQSMEVVEVARAGGQLRRVTRVRARVLPPLFARFDVPPDSREWDEIFEYRFADRQGTLRIEPVARYRGWLDCSGLYALEALPGRRTLRTVSVSFQVHVAVLGPAIERLAAREVRAQYEAEAAVHRARAASFGSGPKEATVP